MMRAMPHRLARFDHLHASTGELESIIDAVLDDIAAGGEDDLLAAAQRVAEAVPEFADEILACALGRGLLELSPPGLELGSVVFGRWTVVSSLGAGATARAS